MYYIDFNGLKDVSSILKYLRSDHENFSIYFNGITVAFYNKADLAAFANGIECIYNVLSEI